jgi:hypothetical protein
MEHVVEIGIFRYVCGEFGDTFAFARVRSFDDFS